MVAIIGAVGGVQRDLVCCNAFCHVTFQDSEMSDFDSLPGPETNRMEGENAPLYCICRKPDINCFMMYVYNQLSDEYACGSARTFAHNFASRTASGCDNCNEWFHGHCINITEKMAKAIQEWYCMKCKGEDEFFFC